MDKLILALDIGTTGIKLALVGTDGLTHYSQYRSYETHFMQGNRSEQDPEDWWNAASAVIRNLALTKKELQARISGIAVTGQMQDLILLHGDRPVRPAILYTDMRAADEAETVNKIIGTETLRRVTGNDQDAGSLLSKLLWVQKYDSASLAEADALLIGAHDYIVYKLCGEKVSDVVTASTTGLLNLEERAWARDQLEKLGLPNLPLGKLTPGGAMVGQLSTRTAILLGLPKGLPIYHGPGDAGATTLGVGAGEEGAVYAYVGTSGWIGLSAQKRGDPDQGVWTLSHPKANYFIPVAPILTAGGCLEWLRRHD